MRKREKTAGWMEGGELGRQQGEEWVLIARRGVEKKR